MSQQGTAVLVKIKLSAPPKVFPDELFNLNPPRLVLSFFDTSDATGQTKDLAGIGYVLQSTVKQTGTTTKVTLDLDKPVRYSTLLEALSDRTEYVVKLDPALAPSKEMPFVKPAHIPASSITIHAKNIDARTLLKILSDATNQNLAIGDELLDRRIDVDETNIDPTALIERVAHSQDLATRRVGNVLAIASECRLSQVPAIPFLHNDQERISINYSHVAAGALTGAAGILHNELQVPFDSVAVNDQAALTVKIKFDTIREELQMIALVEGWEAQAQESGGIRLRPNSSISQCESGIKKHAGQQVAASSPDASWTCPASHAARQCVLLEGYELDKLIPLGFMLSNGMPAQSAFIETPAGEVFVVNAGDYLGRNFGTIKKISQAGIEITESIQDDKGLSWDRSATLPYR